MGDIRHTVIDDASIQAKVKKASMSHSHEMMSSPCIPQHFPNLELASQVPQKKEEEHVIKLISLCIIFH